jgi:hypothetical protein
MILKTKQRVETLCIIIGELHCLFLAYLFKLNYYSWFSYPWSIPIQLNSSINLILSCFHCIFDQQKKKGGLLNIAQSNYKWFYQFILSNIS